MNQYMNYRKWRLSKQGNVYPQVPFEIDVQDAAQNKRVSNSRDSQGYPMKYFSREEVDADNQRTRIPPISVMHFDDAHGDNFRRGISHVLGNLRYVVPLGQANYTPPLNGILDPDSRGNASSHLEHSPTHERTMRFHSNPEHMNKHLAEYAGLLMANLFHRGKTATPVVPHLDDLYGDDLPFSHVRLQELPKDSIYNNKKFPDKMDKSDKSDLLTPSEEALKKEKLGELLGDRLQRLFLRYLNSSPIHNDPDGFTRFLSNDVAEHGHEDENLDPIVQYIVEGHHLPSRSIRNETTEN